MGERIESWEVVFGPATMTRVKMKQRLRRAIHAGGGAGVERHDQ